MFEFLNTVNVQFTGREILSLIGLSQCVYILVYMLSRVGHKIQALIPILFFFSLGAAFFLDVAERYWGPYLSYYGDLNWFFWSSLPPLSVLLIVQIANMRKLPSWPFFLILAFLPIGYIAAKSMVTAESECVDDVCLAFFEWLMIGSVIIGSICLLSIWLKRGLLATIQKQKRGKERLWLTIFLIILNVILLTSVSANAYGLIILSELVSIRTILGFAFVYLASTSLFRIYPLTLNFKKVNMSGSLNESEIAYAKKIMDLLEIEKIYQEPSYGRSHLAAEIGVTESSLSKIVNGYFEKTVPQLLNTYRIKDAKQLLLQTDADLGVISKEAGFNSISTFNRYFKELEGVSPSVYRQSKQGQ
ncbi:MAG: AraC family transcriptional regulator [Alphaproteobacteria bacterium]|nr:AraC family transcriptional regulator [Alphaproteobacteria bacterium]NCQ87773.1 AraC family transcriptional regulator [Alphaproteobacteria bacterium]NCT05719.1 AraC family transcriptional regulator [Alphaproteobacteria bacterium]